MPAPPERVYAALRAIDFAGSPVIRALWLLRSLGRERTMTWAALERLGFAIVGDAPPVRSRAAVGLHTAAPGELVLGLIARPWLPDGGIVRVTGDDWRAYDRPGVAKIGWSFAIGERALATETRVRCTDAASRAKFRWYWRVIGPFSGWIRREMLRLVAKRAAQR